MDKIPFGLCHCGCGRKTHIAKETSSRDKTIKGRPMKFLSGHNTRVRRKPIEQRFWSKVDKRGAKDCWEWKGRCNPDGYGAFDIGKESAPAHRVAFHLAFGDIPEGLLVCHRCDNPPCCNPAHLFLGTHRDNSDDMIAKGRAVYPFGEQHGCAKLTSNQVLEIRERYHRGGVSQDQLALEYSVSQLNISRIVRRKIWKHT